MVGANKNSAMGVHVTRMLCPEVKETMRPIIVKASIARVVARVSKLLKNCARTDYASVMGGVPTPRITDIQKERKPARLEEKW
jgi:hypothetical protein